MGNAWRTGWWPPKSYTSSPVKGLSVTQANNGKHHSEHKSCGRKRVADAQKQENLSCYSGKQKQHKGDGIKIR